MLYQRIQCSCLLDSGEYFDCENIVTLNAVGNDNLLDWDTCIDEFYERHFFKSREELALECHPNASREEIRRMSTLYVKNLKAEIIQWLDINIPDVYSSSLDVPHKAWATGTAYQRANDANCLHVYFKRKEDALRFIKTFSVHKEPATYIDHIDGDYKEINISS